ncbi:MAG: helix-turn-helix domain-containing protein [Acidimicrobiales bacterium]
MSDADTAESFDTEPRLRIGEAALAAGVSARTLRYYQEIGLLTPAGTTAGGARRYSEADVARVGRIRHLRDLVGLDLNEAARVLAAEDRLAAIRRAWFADQTPRRQAALLHEALQINAEVRDIINAKMLGLTDFLQGLEERADAYRRKLQEIEAADLVSGAGGAQR